MTPWRIAACTAGAFAVAVTVLFIAPEPVRAIPDTPVGSHMLEFELSDIDGNLHRLADLRGNVIVIYSWSHLCNYVRATDPYVEELIDKYYGKDVKFFAVDARESFSPVPVSAYQERYGYRATVLVDPRNYYLRDLKVRDVPEFFVVDRDGRLVYRGGFDDRTSIVAPGPIRYVESAIDSVLGGQPVKVASQGIMGCRMKNLIEEE